MMLNWVGLSLPVFCPPEGSDQLSYLCVVAKWMCRRSLLSAIMDGSAI